MRKLLVCMAWAACAGTPQTPRTTWVFGTAGASGRGDIGGIGGCDMGRVIGAASDQPGHCRRGESGVAALVARFERGGLRTGLA